MPETCLLPHKPHSIVLSFIACRTLLLSGDFFLGGVIAGALSKLVLRLHGLPELTTLEKNRATAEALLLIVSMLRLGESGTLPQPVDDDAADRMVICMQVSQSCSASADLIGSRQWLGWGLLGA